MGNVFPPQFGVPLTADELNSNIPTSILYGVTPSNSFIPIQINSAGALSISGTISVGTVTIEGVDPVDTSTHPLAIVNFGPDGYALRTAIFDEGNQLKVNADGSINISGFTGAVVGIKNASDVRINPSTEDTQLLVLADLDKFQFSGGALVVTSTGTPGIPVNKFSENTTVPSSILTPILSYTVPGGKTLNITRAYGWGTFDGEFIIKVDSTVKGGGWTSAADRNFHVDYVSAPIPAMAGQIVTINVTQYSISTQDFKANLLGTLN